MVSTFISLKIDDKLQLGEYKEGSSNKVENEGTSSTLMAKRYTV